MNDSSNLGISEFLHRRQYFFHRYFTKCSKHILSAECLDGSFYFNKISNEKSSME